MTYLGEVLESKISDGVPIIKLKTLDGTFEAAFYPSPNTISRPENGSVVLHSKGSQSNEYIAHSGISQIIKSEIQAGEYIIFSTDNNQVKSFIHLKKNGELVFNDGTDSAVKYSELNTKLTELQNQITDITAKFNSHLHSGTAGPYPFVVSTTPTQVSPNPITSFESIKVEKVKL